MSTVGPIRTGRVKDGSLDSSVACGQPMVLHLFSGPSGRHDSLHYYLRERGLVCREFDLVNGSDQNLADDIVWDGVRHLLNTVAGAVMGPPCSTFSAVRGLGIGPRRLRDDAGVGIYGVSGLTGKEKESVRIGKPFLLEQPWPRNGQPSMLKLPELVDVLALDGVVMQR
eukprot:1524946-Amphidinium_carterae.1